MATQLRVGEQPLACKPDAVLRHRRSGEIIIIERKFTRGAYHHPSAWANLRAQLWCYSQIDDWAKAPDVYLVGQLWVQEAGQPEGRAKLFEQFAPSWKRSDVRFCLEMQDLFKLYGGQLGRPNVRRMD